MQEIVEGIVKELFDVDLEVSLTRPEPQFGDFATNVSLQLAKPLGQNPRQIAEQIAEKLRQTGQFAEVNVAGPGFINIRLSDKKLLELASIVPAKTYENLSYVTEYSCPNAFKELHTGHLYQTILGDVIARLIEHSGAKVSRTSFGGDIGLHVAKCLYGMVVTLGGELPEKLSEISDDPMDRARWISQCYVLGSKSYEEDAEAKEAIDNLNKVIYAFHSEDDQESPLAQIYWQTRQWSFDYFKAFYELLKVDGMRYIPESETAGVGLEIVQVGLERGVFKESDGAVVYEGSLEQNLHTRVFVTSKGLPTYETKDLGVINTEKNDYNFDKRLLITGNDQYEYMKVVFAAADELEPGIAETMKHITNGTVRFADGKKMSSRLGNVARAIEVIEVIRQKVREMGTVEEQVEEVALGAVKYQFLKYRVGGDISFDIEDSVSLQGNSGPYIQYAHARACSILEKAVEVPAALEGGVALDTNERMLALKLSEYNEVVSRSTEELMPHLICGYLYELAQEFNRFYEKSRIIGDAREAIRLTLVKKYQSVLADGLGKLGIAAPERM